MPERIPSLTLPSATGGTAVDLRASRGPRVVVALHDPACAECLRYVGEIAALRGELAEWGADVVIVSPVAVASRETLAALDLPVVEDVGHAFAQGRLAVIVTDEWGEVYHATGDDDPTSVHDVVPAAEVIEWAKFVAIQCPECEGPEGGWRDL